MDPRQPHGFSGAFQHEPDAPCVVCDHDRIVCDHDHKESRAKKVTVPKPQRLRVLVMLNDTLVTDIDTVVETAAINRHNDVRETGESPTTHTYRATDAKALTIDWREKP